MKIIEKIAANAKDNQKNSQPTIVFLGDSVTQGCYRMNTDYEAVYHNRLKKKLNFLFPGAVVNVINAGIGGTDAALGVERLNRDVLSKNPDLCVVCFGLNDVNGLEEGIQRYADNLECIFQKISETGCEVIFMTPNMMNTELTEVVPEKWSHVAPVTAKHQNEGLMDKYMAAAVETAKKNNVRICDCYAKWKKLAACGVDTNRLLANGINHPLREMHELFANSLLETMFE